MLSSSDDAPSRNSPVPKDGESSEFRHDVKRIDAKRGDRSEGDFSYL